MKTILISYEGFEELPGGDIRQFAYEEHQIIITEDEQFLGCALFYKGSEPKEIDLPKS
jgi:predicted nuclease of predicted toxin-antitoxin system